MSFKAPPYEPHEIRGDAAAAADPVRTRGICRSVHPSRTVTVLGERPASGGLVAPALAVAGLVASGETNLQETQALLWIMIGISVAGAIVTFAFLVYAVVRFRDRTKKGRHYG